MTKLARGVVGVLVCGASLVNVSCSLAAVRGPPRGHQQMTFFHCTESYGTPTFEAGMAAVSLVALPVAAMYATSAFMGFTRVSECRAAKREVNNAFWQTMALPEGLRPDVSINAVRLAPGADTLAVGGTRQLRAAAVTAKGDTIAGRTFLWTTFASAIASVDATGVVSAKVAGSTTIQATTGGVFGTKLVVVVP